MDMFRGFRLIAEWRRKRDERLWADFESMRANVAARGAHIADVETIRQKARTGTKAYVRWLDTGEVDAVWARARRLSKGQMLALSGRRGYGEHHDEPVFYIDRAGPRVDRRTYSGWARHEARRVGGAG